MKYLVFPRDGSAVRSGTLLERSLLPVSAACVVANAVRERLSAIAGIAVDVRLWPPAIPSSSAWETLLDGAQVHPIRGSACDAAIVLRRVDAQSLAALLFGERVACEEHAHRLSRLENEITRRAVASIMPSLTAVCGECTLSSSQSSAAFATYFELHVVEPFEFCIGVALSREPGPAQTRRFVVEHVLPATTEAIAEISLRRVTAAAIAALQPGEVLRVDTSEALLRVAGRAVARGSCGSRAKHYAFEVRERTS